MDLQDPVESGKTAPDSVKLSDYCIINHFEAVDGFGVKFSPWLFLRAPLLLLDRKMHFTGLRGGLWRTLGVDRSQKNPNICNI